MGNDIFRKEKLIKRLRYLGTWELFDSFFLPAVAILSAKAFQWSMGFLTIYSAGLVAWILWQGTVYWLLKFRAVQTDSRIAREPIRWFAVLKKVNWVLIGMLPILLGIQCLAGGSFNVSFDLVVGFAFYTLAVLEQINYYYYQLMYDYPPDWRYLVACKKLKRSSLSRALEKLRD